MRGKDLSGARPLEFINGALNDGNSAWKACLSLWSLSKGESFSLEFSSPALYSKQILLDWPLPSFNDIIRVSMVERVEEGSLHAVLTWGAEPRDLDFHVINIALLEQHKGSVDKTNHIFYGNPAERWGGVSLDVDAQHGYGPETILFKKSTQLGAYRLEVQVYTGNTFGSGVGEVAVEIFSQGISEKLVPDKESVAKAKTWYVGDVIKTDTGFNFKRSGQTRNKGN